MTAAKAKTVHQRMLAILDELPAIGKDQRNTQQGFMFRGHDDILNALNPLLAKHGVIVVPDVVERQTAQRTTSKGGVMYEVNLHVRYRFIGEDGDFVEASTWGEGTDSGDKATNKAMTMAFKNVLNQAFAISSAEFKDADAETPEATTGRQTQNGNGAADQAKVDILAELIGKRANSDETRDRLLAHYGVADLIELTNGEAAEAIMKLKAARS